MLGTKKPGLIGYDEAGHRPGNDLLSQGLSPHYHRRNSVSLPGSEWDRVVPPCYGHQKADEEFCILGRYSGCLSSFCYDVEYVIVGF